MVEKEASVDEGETILVAVVVRGIVSMVSMPGFCSLSKMARYQSVMVP